MKNKSIAPRIKVILFDFGNVLVVDTEKVLEQILGLKKLPKWKRDRYEAASHVSERGQEPTREFLKTFKKIFGLPYTVKQLNQLFTSSALIKPMWLLLKKLSHSYTVAILSNNQKLWPGKTAKKLHIKFGKIKFFNSAYIGKRKPQQYPYAYVAVREHAEPEEIIFIDDKTANVRAAQKAGMHAIRFAGDMPALIKHLKSLGVEVKI